MNDANCKIPLWVKIGTKELDSKYSAIRQLENNYDAMRYYYIDKILKDDKNIPTIEQLNQDGEWYGRRDFNKSGIDGFDWSYFMMRYLISQNIDISTIIGDEQYVANLESNLVPNTLSYFNNFFNTNRIKNNFDEVETPEELMDYMIKHFNYGYIDINGEKHLDTLNGVNNNYKINPTDVTKRENIGTCLDQLKLEKEFFDKKGIETKVFYVKYKNTSMNNTKDHIHTILAYKDNDSWCSFEHSFYNQRGIHKFDNVEDTYNYFIENGLNSHCVVENVKEINNIPDDLSIEEFMKYADNYEKNNKLK